MTVVSYLNFTFEWLVTEDGIPENKTADAQEEPHPFIFLPPGIFISNDLKSPSDCCIFQQSLLYIKN